MNKDLLPPILKRDKTVPMLMPEMLNHLGNYFSTCNPGAVEDGKGGTHLLLRAIRGKNYPNLPFFTDLIYAHSKDGKTIDTKSLKIMIKPNKQFHNGFEDARITKVKGDDKYSIVCTGYNGKFPRICLWTSTDLADKATYKYEGTIGPTKKSLKKLKHIFGSKVFSNDKKALHDKDAFLLGEKVDGKYMLYHRIGSNIQAVLADNMTNLKSQSFWVKQNKNMDENTIMRNKANTWEHTIGGGPPPIKTKDGWLMIYHASESIEDGQQYCGGVSLCDLKNPRKVISRAPDPIIEPETFYEKNGPVPGVVFPQGLVENGDNLLLYYGCGDKNVGVAETKISELLKYVKNFDENGNIKHK